MVHWNYFQFDIWFFSPTCCLMKNRDSTAERMTLYEPARVIKLNNSTSKCIILFYKHLLLRLGGLHLSDAALFEIEN